jgi:prepilin-type N-terminal cleavage/methylation domain-containing protein
MRIKNRNRQSGFTLFEIIIVLILMGILAVGFSLGLVKGIEHYIFAREAGHLSQKAQLAMARIKKELTDATLVYNKSGTQIEYGRPYSPPSCQQTECRYRIVKSNDQILLVEVFATGQAPAANVLIDRIATDSSSSGSNFLTYVNFNGTEWSLESANKVDNLAQIRVFFTVDYGANQSLKFQTTVNPRQGAKMNIPKLN